MTPAELPSDDEALDDVLLGAVTALRAPVAPRIAALDALKSAVSAESVSGAGRPLRPVEVSRVRWFTTPRAVHASPLTLLAAATLLVVGASVVTARLAAPRQGESEALRAVTGDADRAAQVVRFTLAAPDARRVSVVGDFNGWDPMATALRQENGIWTVVIPVVPGRHQYGFVIDGATLIADPAAARSTDSDFGTQNSVVYVGG